MKSRQKKPYKSSKRTYRPKRKLDPGKIRKKLVDNITGGEQLMRTYLRGLKIKFEFQKVINLPESFYVVDFYLPKYNLVLEIDGKYHSKRGQKAKDKHRERIIKSMGYKLKRLSNSQVYNWHINKIFEFIEK